YTLTGTDTIKIANTSNDSKISVNYIDLSRKIVSTQSSNAISLGKDFLLYSAGSVAIPDSVYYDDTNQSTGPEDGTIKNPYKTMAKAVTEASTKSDHTGTGTGTAGRRHTVRALDGASLACTEDFTIGKDPKSSLAITIFTPNISYTGTISVNLNSSIPDDGGIFSLICQNFSGQIKTKGGEAVSTTTNYKAGITIELTCKRKTASSTKSSFLAELESLNSETKFANKFLKYIENCDKVIEKHETTGTTTPSILFKLPTSIIEGKFWAEYAIKSIIKSEKNTSKKQSYVEFTIASGTFDHNNNTERAVYSRLLDNPGEVFNFSSSTNSTLYRCLSSELIDVSNANISNINSHAIESSGNLTGLNVIATNRLNLPKLHKTATGSTSETTSTKDGDITYNTKDGVMYVYSDGSNKPLSYAIDKIEPLIRGYVVSRESLMDIEIMQNFYIANLGSTGLIHHNESIVINNSENKTINLRRSHITVGTVFHKAKSTDEYIKDHNVEGHALLKKLADISS
ncbi:MAG: hypothetical protein KAH32_08455, partial [Chlamydiia bacterium]|nr:hypothetical protein [Chlamydiia bacterium]